MSMIEHLCDTAKGLDDSVRRMILKEYQDYTEEEATTEIKYLKEFIPITDCRKQFEKMCRDGVFKINN